MFDIILKTKDSKKIQIKGLFLPQTVNCMWKILLLPRWLFSCLQKKVVTISCKTFYMTCKEQYNIKLKCKKDVNISSQLFYSWHYHGNWGQSKTTVSLNIEFLIQLLQRKRTLAKIMRFASVKITCTNIIEELEFCMRNLKIIFHYLKEYTANSNYFDI